MSGYSFLANSSAIQNNTLTPIIAYRNIAPGYAIGPSVMGSPASGAPTLPAGTTLGGGSYAAAPAQSISWVTLVIFAVMFGAGVLLMKKVHFD